MEFSLGESGFLVPLSWVQRVSSGEEQGERLITDLFENEAGRNGSEKSRYLILLENGKKNLALKAEKVMGVRDLQGSQLLELKKPVLTDRNRFLCGAVCLAEEEIPLAFLIDPDVLFEMKLG